MIKVIVCGAVGKMGREVIRSVVADPQTTLVGAVDPQGVGLDAGEVAGVGTIDVIVSKDLEKTIKQTKPNVLVDFTHPSSVMENIKTAAKNGVNLVVGTTGITARDLKEIERICKSKKVNAIVAPNFSIGAVLMMKMCELASEYFPDAEIIELHHNQKADAPSGTAIKTAELIAEKRKEKPSRNPKEKETISGVRGGDFKGVKIHSVRLPGLVAHQEVIFSGPGQVLSIRHDSFERTSFMPGVLMAIKSVVKKKGLTYGLEKLIGL